jgi:glycosyltransferase involved in cell wall biosynthesis
MSRPLISVIFPVHNNADTIEVALASISKQTYSNLEIIVVDDHSTDATKEKVLASAQEDPRIHYFFLEADDPERFDMKLKKNINAGYSARNFGFTKAHGELITFQDGDDASLLNRVEVQYELLTRNNAVHIATGWRPFDAALLNTTGNTTPTGPLSTPEELYTLSQKTKGLVAKTFSALNTAIPFHYKRLPVVHKLFFGALTPYPGAGNSPLFKREVVEKVQFRKLKYREWPSFMGRGADRDFNFKVAEVFRNSYVVPIPLYLWRTSK